MVHQIDIYMLPGAVSWAALKYHMPTLGYHISHLTSSRHCTRYPGMPVR